MPRDCRNLPVARDARVLLSTASGEGIQLHHSGDPSRPPLYLRLEAEEGGIFKAGYPIRFLLQRVPQDIRFTQLPEGLCASTRRAGEISAEPMATLGLPHCLWHLSYEGLFLPLVIPTQALSWF